MPIVAPRMPPAVPRLASTSSTATPTWRTRRYTSSTASGSRYWAKASVVRKGPVKLLGSKPIGRRQTSSHSISPTRKNHTPFTARNSRSAQRRWAGKSRVRAACQARMANPTMSRAFKLMPRCCPRSPTVPFTHSRYRPLRLPSKAATMKARPTPRCNAGRRRRRAGTSCTTPPAVINRASSRCRLSMVLPTGSPATQRDCPGAPPRAARP
mmetsp:Transcript_23212/g.54898  ORF Transcript_23212/g.54898 Transcript_23212/m.54898 type:complete len:211 (-) Transcript_23212:703-1335(-)